MVTFSAFERLKNAYGMTDAELKEALSGQCMASAGATYIDDVTSIIIELLTYATGIPWRRAYENAERDEVQYGTVFVIDKQDKHTRSIESSCESVQTTSRWHVQLDTYRDTNGSSYDVLTRAQNKLKLLPFIEAAAEHCVFDLQIENIKNLPEELRHSVFETRATADLYFYATSSASIPMPDTRTIPETELCEEL